MIQHIIADKRYASWITAVRNAPQFGCGRLDGSTWTADTGEPCRFVYVGEDPETPRYEVRGRWCDEITFAAANYQGAMNAVDYLLHELRRVTGDDCAAVEQNVIMRLTGDVR